MTIILDDEKNFLSTFKIRLSIPNYFNVGKFSKQINIIWPGLKWHKRVQKISGGHSCKIPQEVIIGVLVWSSAEFLPEIVLH